MSEAKLTWVQGFLVGAAVGIGLGTLLGVLYAPEKGTRTRRHLARRAEDLGDRATDAIEAAGDLVERGRRRVGL
jgi:gas vesicle protein